MNQQSLSIFALLGIALSTGAAAQEGNARAGERLVKAECTRCHAVEPGAASRDPGAPNFAAVARMPSATDLSLRVFLRSPHRSMPDLVLSQEEASDVIAYIRSLAR